jgi:hypothetical protein
LKKNQVRPLGLQKDQDTAFTCSSSLTVFPLPNWLPSLKRLMCTIKSSETLEETYSAAMAERWVAASLSFQRLGPYYPTQLVLGRDYAHR